MEKTNTKAAVKNVQAPSRVNENQKKMDKIVTNMAILFEKKIPASGLAKWVSTVTVNSDPNDDLVSQLGYYILPGLIDAKTSDERIDFLKKQLPETCFYYDSFNRSLFQYGEDFLKSYKGLIYGAEEIEGFMSIFLPLSAICAMVKEYEYYDKEMKKLEIAA